MGYTTDFIGHIDITPPLEDAEIEYLTAFSEVRHCGRPGGPYAIAPNPFAPETDLSTSQFNAVPEGQCATTR